MDREDLDDFELFGMGCIAWFVIAIVAIVMVSGLVWVALATQHDMLYPQIRQNKIDDPDTTIANRKDFHSKIGEIIAADQNVQTDLDALVRCQKTNCANVDRLTNELIGVEQIRSNAINAYNAQSDNPDVGKDRETWMPKHIDVRSIPTDNSQAQQFLQDEISHLQSIYNKGF